MRFAVFARAVSVLAVLLCWPVIGLAALVKPRRDGAPLRWRPPPSGGYSAGPWDGPIPSPPNNPASASPVPCQCGCERDNPPKPKPQGVES